MISKSLFMLMLVFTIFFVVYADEVVAATCDDEITDGSCNVVKSFCGMDGYLTETNLCKKTCGMCGEPVLLA